MLWMTPTRTCIDPINCAAHALFATPIPSLTVFGGPSVSPEALCAAATFGQSDASMTPSAPISAISRKTGLRQKRSYARIV